MHIIIDEYHFKKRTDYLDNIVIKEFLLFNDPNPDEYDETYYSLKYNPNLELAFNNNFIIIPRYIKNTETNNKNCKDKCIICLFLESCDNYGQYGCKDFRLADQNINYNCENLLSDSDAYTHYYKTYFLHELSETKAIISDSYRLNEYYYIWKIEDYNAIIHFLNTTYPTTYKTIFNIMANEYKDSELAFKQIKLNGTYRMSSLVDTVTNLLTKKDN